MPIRNLSLRNKPFVILHSISQNKEETMKYIMTSLLFGILTLLLAACSTTTSVVQNPNYTLGKQDGCATANGEYRKDSNLFKADPDYESGWFAGRKECNPSFHKE
jgi:hypothetical protein